MAKNKVVFGNTTIMDISDSTVTPEKVLKDEVAYNAAGEKIVGTYEGGGGSSSLVIPLLKTMAYHSSSQIAQGCAELYLPVTNYTNLHLGNITTETTGTIIRSAFVTVEARRGSGSYTLLETINRTSIPAAPHNINITNYDEVRIGTLIEKDRDKKGTATLIIADIEAS